MSKQVGRSIVKIPISSIRVDEHNPRKTFQEIDAFAESLQTTEDIQVPILVEELGDGNYFLVDGERRLRSAKKAGITQIWADVRKSLSDVERGIIRAKLNFQHWNWETGEGVNQLNALYDAWLAAKNRSRRNETKGQRIEFARLIGISEGSLLEKLRFGDSALRDGIEKIPALEALEKGQITFEAARKVASKSSLAQREIIRRAEELRQTRPKEEPKITKRSLLQAKAEYEVKTAETKTQKNRAAYDDIIRSHRVITDQMAEIRERMPYLFKADTAREVMEMLDDMGKVIISIQQELQKQFPDVKPRRMAK